MKPCLVGIDRDGTLIEDVGWLGRGSDWRSKITVLSRIPEGLTRLKENKHLRLALITGQSGIARGYFGLHRMFEVNHAVLAQLPTDVFDSVQYCPFVPLEYALEHGIPPHSPWVSNTDLRKPGIGMLRAAAKDMGFTLENFARVYAIGDKEEDVQMGLNAGGIGILVLTGQGQRNRAAVQALQTSHPGRVFVRDTFYQAAHFVLEDMTRHG